jgi:hypothetical protein
MISAHRRWTLADPIGIYRSVWTHSMLGCACGIGRGELQGMVSLAEANPPSRVRTPDGGSALPPGHPPPAHAAGLTSPPASGVLP